MDLKQLRYFVQVAELGSFARASDVLDVAQPTLSRQVRALELSLHASLLHRTGRGVELTPTGARFLEQARGVLHAADAAMQVLQGPERRFIGHVACGMTPSVGRRLAAEYVRRFRQELPQATLTISSHPSLVLQEQMRAARLDFAIVHDPVASPSVEIISLRRQALFVVGTTSLGGDADSVGIQALHKVPLLLPSRNYVVRIAVELAAARAGVTLDIPSEVDVLDSIFELVAEGIGHTVATETAIVGLNQRQGLSVQRLAARDLFIELALVMPVARNLTPLQRKAAELTHDVFQAVSAATGP